MDPVDFLESVAGYTAAQKQTSSADQPIRIGTIDPAYVAASFPGTQPKVTFDGESTLSGKAYKVLAPGYAPTAGDRVVLLPIGTTYAIVGAVTTAAAAYVGGALAVAGLLTASAGLAVTGALTSAGRAIPGGFVEYGSVTAGTVATSTSATEVAIPAASWAHEPNPTFTNGRIYKVEVQYGLGLTGTSDVAPSIRIRKGSASISGTVLGRTVLQPHPSALAFHSQPPMVRYVQNVSGADITTKLSLSISDGNGTNSARLYGDGSAVPLMLTVQDLGLASGHALVPLAVSIT